MASNIIGSSRARDEIEAVRAFQTNEDSTIRRFEDSESLNAEKIYRLLKARRPRPTASQRAARRGPLSGALPASVPRDLKPFERE